MFSADVDALWPVLYQDTQAALWTQRWATGHQSELPGGGDM